LAPLTGHGRRPLRAIGAAFFMSGGVGGGEISPAFRQRTPIAQSVFYTREIEKSASKRSPPSPSA